MKDKKAKAKAIPIRYHMCTDPISHQDMRMTVVWLGIYGVCASAYGLIGVEPLASWAMMVLITLYAMFAVSSYNRHMRRHRNVDESIIEIKMIPLGKVE